jgi:PERQ amino acid-rich with GYF domain-containing protein
MSPTENKTFFQSNAATPPPALLRRRTDYKDEESTPSTRENLDPEETPDSQPSFTGLRHIRTGGPLSAGLNPSSTLPWSAGPQSAGFSSMGGFGNFGINSPGQPSDPAEKRAGFGSGRGLKDSRFKDILSKPSNEDFNQVGKDKGQFGGLEKLPEEDADIQARTRDNFRTRPGRSETNPYDDAPMRLGGARESMQPSPGIEQMGMSAFPSHSAIGTRDFGHGEPYQQTPHAARFNALNAHEPMSPTNTNPYQSPQGQARLEDDERETMDSASQASGHNFPGAPRRGMYPSNDEGRLSAGGMRSASGFGGLPGLGGLANNPWSSAGLSSNTMAPDRGVISAFRDPTFSPLAELQSPGGLGGGFPGFGASGRPSRLGGMLPSMMQDQFRGDGGNDPAAYGSRPDSGLQQPMRDPFEGTGRRSDEFGHGSGMFDDMLQLRNTEDPNIAGQFGHPRSLAVGDASAQTLRPRTSGLENQPPGLGSRQSEESSPEQVPTAQQRQMVMPDRMRWIYRDPQGNLQGPWSGLEMHDWFKAGFFTAELQVKKLEDTEFEPLAQLVRRIGNSREPFLVPQIGVPHGPPAAGPGNTWANPPVAAPGTAAQPPFANNFPSFGTTLTAEQQNALERRKQEEQYLMARQKEHLAQQQMAMKMQMQNGMHSLQHHSSQHSLQSQPSFNSITSPVGYQPSPIQPKQQPQVPQTMPFGHQQGPGMGPVPGREEELPGMMDRLSFAQRANMPFSNGPLGPPPSEAGPSQQQINTMFQDRARLQQQQQQSDMRGQDTFLGQQGRNERLDEFNTLRGQVDAPAGRLGPEDLPRQQPIGAPRQVSEQLLPPQKLPAPIGHPAVVAKPESETLSLAQQVQIAAASQQAAAEESAWAKKETLVEPPPVSISPLPAPAAQRNRQHVADALAAESRSTTQTPVETPSASLAPWAERATESAKGPSLKEIQEAEAKRAAEQEVIAAAARRAQAEQERLAQSQVVAPAPGLPTTSTWGSGASPVTPGTQAASVWGASKTPAKAPAGTATAPKKTLAQIQKEEENRKQRAAQQATQAQVATTNNAPTGKRYAELAGKAVPAAPASNNSAWTTVGSSGKAKAPAAVVAMPQPVARTVSASTVTKARPALQTSRSAVATSQSKANDEFIKWIKASLGKGLNSGITRESHWSTSLVFPLTISLVDTFVEMLMALPSEVDVIRDSVYSSSNTLDGRRFAEEFVRRRKLVDKGIVESATGAQPMLGLGASADTKSNNGAGGWSEVAKKGPAAPPKEESANQAFKVVPSKKKGGKR